MLDRSAVESPARATEGGLSRRGRERRRALVACTVLVFALHAAFIGNIGGASSGAVEASLPPMSLRTLADEASLPTHVEAVMEAAQAVAVPPAPTSPLPPKAPTARPAREPTAVSNRPSVVDEGKASANSTDKAALASTGGAGALPRPAAVDTPIMAAGEVRSGGSPDAGEGRVPAESAAASPGPPSLLAPGEEPPPLYRTRLPAAVTLHYQVRRGLLRGSGQIRWSPVGDRYRLVLEAQVAGLTLLKQTSEGDLGVNGLAPVRFLDQRARRSAQAANFRRDDGRITFSGTGVEWPLLAGSQDRLSWMIQLAGIAAAEPERLVDGGEITMVVIGARGDAGVWTLRFAGRETIATVAGTVHAVKMVRAGRSAYDTSAEIWLDPERSYLPAQATLRNAAGAPEFDLLLERVDLE